MHSRGERLFASLPLYLRHSVGRLRFRDKLGFSVLPKLSNSLNFRKINNSDPTFYSRVVAIPRVCVEKSGNGVENAANRDHCIA